MNTILVNKKNKNLSDNYMDYQKLLEDKEAIIIEQNNIINQQREYIYKLLNELEAKSSKFSFKLNFAKLMNIIF
ncbi:MAG TPA: hypothetical protein PLM75_11160 [bacterium]|nr:hypothetical protein [bacterium]HPP88406.1 hypothetical protein [bacterium]